MPTRFSNWIEVFWQRVDKNGAHGCWVWMGSTTGSDAYGVLYASECKAVMGTLRAHRIAYILSRGPVESGVDIHHTCHNRLCVNPAHLEPLSHAEHGRIHPSPLYGKGRKPRQNGYCKRGHFVGGNNAQRMNVLGKNYYSCKQCSREGHRRIQ